MNNVIENYIQEIINKSEEVVSYAELNKELNSQWFLNFLDTLNEISVRY